MVSTVRRWVLVWSMVGSGSVPSRCFHDGRRRGEDAKGGAEGRKHGKR